MSAKDLLVVVVLTVFSPLVVDALSGMLFTSKLGYPTPDSPEPEIPGLV